jgi:hypothetical protein
VLATSSQPSNGDENNVGQVVNEVVNLQPIGNRPPRVSTNPLDRWRRVLNGAIAASQSGACTGFKHYGVQPACIFL